MDTINILIAGVGGQGTLLASRVLGSFALKSGYDCKLSEVHGMAQRGGSVVTHVKMGNKIYSPIIEKGEADLLLAFEQLEAARYIDFVKKGGKVVVSSQTIMPMSVVTGAMAYPYDILEKLSSEGYNIVKIDAADIALKAGNLKASNIVMIGCLTRLLNLDKDKMIEAISESVPAKSLEVNLMAFLSGYTN